MWIQDETIKAVLSGTGTKKETKMALIDKEAALAEMDYYISAKKLIEDILEARGIEIETVPKLIRLIKAQPKQEPRRGRWIQKSEPLELCTYWWYECSACGNKPPNDNYGHPNHLSPYCPNCGAKMEGEK